MGLCWGRFVIEGAFPNGALHRCCDYSETRFMQWAWVVTGAASSSAMH